jgi:hypothetical protein
MHAFWHVTGHAIYPVPPFGNWTNQGTERRTDNEESRKQLNCITLGI